MRLLKNNLNALWYKSKYHKIQGKWVLMLSLTKWVQIHVVKPVQTPIIYFWIVFQRWPGWPSLLFNRGFYCTRCIIIRKPKTSMYCLYTLSRVLPDVICKSRICLWILLIIYAFVFYRIIQETFIWNI